MERIQLTMKEIKRLELLEEKKHLQMDQRSLSKRLRVSVRQAQRIIKRYDELGAKGLVHRGRGKPSGRAMPQEKKDTIVRLIQEHYSDFGPVLVSEMLEQRHGIKIHKEQARRIMLDAGIWKARKKRAKHRSWRPPREHRGEMVQLDVSYHQWFEDRAGWTYLVKFVDDATKEILYAEFISGESYHDVARATIQCFTIHGLPKSLYTDKGKVFKVNVNNDNNEFKTQYEYALEMVGVELIHAHSPQAKGRIERSFQTDQDRLVKLLRLENIATMDAANRYLHETYIPHYNSKFTCPPARAHDLHVPLRNVNLYDVFCIRETRVVHNDWTLRYRNRILQITKDQQAVVRPKDLITVCERLDGSLYLELRSFRINFIELDKLPAKHSEPKPIDLIATKRNSSWRKTNHFLFAPKTRHFYSAKSHDIFTEP
ncbi:MAG TPA: ISNCY family transposase [Candidatus Babeliales bacterium]|jgi:transposase|nr:ISNCY family transposase [Candidatus Babeliales bacterium]